MPSYSIKHITRYSYASTVIDCTNQIMLYPVSDQLQEVKKHDLKISYKPTIELFTDYFNNQVGVFSIIRPHTELTIFSTIDVITHPVLLPADDTPANMQWENLSFLSEQFPYMDFLKIDAFKCYRDICDAVTQIVNEKQPPFYNAQALSAFVYNNFEYKKGVTSIETEIDDVWKLKAGVCQDFAHLLLLMLRMINIPARYVSGYICPKNHELRGEGATHAWVEAYIPFYGWIGLDPTNNCVVSDRHVRLAIGRNFGDCTPVKGTYKGSSDHRLEVSVSIENGLSKIAANNNNVIEMPMVVSYQAHNPAIPENSYRRFQEMQQQQ
ncbi:transglutaminase family protein [Pinibacter soli]|uniref:Transglutaminase family protein n=1 Tax=Pinibacter soli TaxID=3044211 RepID=A0ABT6R771_9BACT|nr:transglutaminase family protein [Pinibacter soli]MDI3318410.1 transglutaminase family protein [Pinibacter soli]